jgi:hypothetical protein
MDKVNGSVNLFLMHQVLVVTRTKESIIMTKNMVLASFNGKVVILMQVITIWTKEMVLE